MLHDMVCWCEYETIFNLYNINLYGKEKQDKPYKFMVGCNQQTAAANTTITTLLVPLAY